MRGKAVRREILRGVAATLVVVGLLELALRLIYVARNSMVTHVPLPYVIGDEYGPVPPWLDELMILAPDDALIWRNRPNLRRRYVDIFSPTRRDEERTALLRRFWPRLPESVTGSPVWEISLNSQGFRDTEVLQHKGQAAFRIVCLGDSWTFGMNVGQQQAYPQRLRALFEQAFPEGKFEVLNRGVLGYSSHQGLLLLRDHVLSLNPDVLVIGFAMNDAKTTGYRDRDLVAYEKDPTWMDRMGRVFEKSEFYKFMRYLALLVRYTPRSIADYLKPEEESAGDTAAIGDLEEPQSAARVSPKDYEQNIVEMIRLARRGNADVILVYNELWDDGPYRAALGRVSSREGVPLVDSAALIEEGKRRIEAGLERRLDLEPPQTGALGASGESAVIFRVYLGTTPVPKTISIVGNHPRLGNLVPNKVAMYDDGTHGDQRAGDTVWTYAATFPAGTTLSYVYTNSGVEGEWEGLDVPHIREFAVEAAGDGGKLYRPIESFGKIYMQADSWHPDASGYELIARSLFDVLKGSQRLKDYLRRATVAR